MATTTIPNLLVREFFAQGDSEKAKELADALNALILQINANFADLEGRVDTLENV